MQTITQTRSFWRSEYWFVLALIVVSYALCASQSSPDPSSFVLLVQLATVAVTLRVARVNSTLRRIGWIVIAVAAVAVALGWLLGQPGHVLDVILSAASIGAFLAAPIAIIAHQARAGRVDGEALLAAISAYVLVGMFFTFVYNVVSLTSATPIFESGRPDSLTTQLFFSFTTLTTTGYGNLSPAGPVVQSIAVVEAITGQLFLVIAVARIIAGWSRRA